eukprot:SAG11_NODE_1074_length_5968_cov_2.041063_11_plen_110_part_00
MPPPSHLVPVDALVHYGFPQYAKLFLDSNLTRDAIYALGNIDKYGGWTADFDKWEPVRSNPIVWSLPPAARGARVGEHVLVADADANTEPIKCLARRTDVGGDAQGGQT